VKEALPRDLDESQGIRIEYIFKIQPKPLSICSKSLSTLSYPHNPRSGLLIAKPLARSKIVFITTSARITY